MASARRAAEPEEEFSREEHLELLERYRYHKQGHLFYKRRYAKYKTQAQKLRVAVIVLACLAAIAVVYGILA